MSPYKHRWVCVAGLASFARLLLPLKPALSVSSDFPPSIPWTPPSDVVEETDVTKDTEMMLMLDTISYVCLSSFYSHLEFILYVMLYQPGYS